MSEERNSIALTLLIVTTITIVLGILFGSLIARSISSVLASFQDGLLNFFQYLNQQQKTARPIVVQGHDEISIMAGSSLRWHRIFHSRGRLISKRRPHWRSRWRCFLGVHIWGDFSVGRLYIWSCSGRLRSAQQPPLTRFRRSRMTLLWHSCFCRWQ